MGVVCWTGNGNLVGGEGTLKGLIDEPEGSESQQKLSNRTFLPLSLFCSPTPFLVTESNKKGMLLPQLLPGLEAHFLCRERTHGMEWLV